MSTALSWVLVALPVVPLIGAGVLLVPASALGRWPLRWHGPVVSGVTLALAVVLAAGFDYGAGHRVQAVTDWRWIPGLDLRFHLGVDGISLPLVVLTALLTFLGFGYLCWGGGDGAGQLRRVGRPRALVFTLLVLEVGMIGTFLALDLLLFFVFFEVVLIPMYFVIALWGGRHHGPPAVSEPTGDLIHPLQHGLTDGGRPVAGGGGAQAAPALGPAVAADASAAEHATNAEEATYAAKAEGAADAEGARRARAAAVKFILFTLLGSAVLLIGLLFVWARTGTLDMVELAARHGAGMSRSAQILAFVAIAGGLAVKTPMWPLHTWLPDAHTEAPTVGSVLLAGVLLKMGTYGFARIAIPILPAGAHAVAPWLGAFAVVGIIYGALACLAQRDLKRMIAYSSIGHMGFVLLGFATLTPVGMNAALFANVAHGLITGLLFFVAGGIKERYGTADLAALGGGMLTRLPRVGSLLTFAAIASLGLPGLAGFWGEMLALVGAFDPAPGLSRPLYLLFMAIGGLGTVLTAAYFLTMLSRVTHGRSPAGAHPPAPKPIPAVAERLGDVTRYELAAWVPLVGLTLLFGLWPKALLLVTTPAAQAVLQGVSP